MRPEGEEEEVGASVVVGGSPEASGRRLSGATDFGLTGGPDAQGPHPEASTGGTGTAVKASDDEKADIRSGRARPAPVSRSGVICPEEGCGKFFTRKDNAERHCVRFHRHYLDGSEAPADLAAKLTVRVKDSDRRRLEAKHLAATSSGVGPSRKARRVGEREVTCA